MEKYKVKLNGQEVLVRNAIGSKSPFNKIWDGIQRDISGTEKIYYVSADICSESGIEIEICHDFENYEIRPRALGLCSMRKDRNIFVKIDRPMQFVVEVDGSHGALHVFINPLSITPRGDVIYFGAGEHNVGLLWLESGQTVYIDENAIVYGVIYAKDAHDIKILGRGVVDSSLYRRGNDYSDGGQEIAEALRDRGFTEVDLKYYGNLVINNCKNVLIEGVVLKDAPLWSLIVRNDSENIVIDNVKIIGQWRYNSDGIDICTSKNVIVRNCFVRSFDDCIVARGAYLEGENGNVEDITFENCVLWCDWGKAAEVWCGHKPTRICNVSFKDIYLVHLNATALNITTWYGSESSVIDGVKYDNIYVDLDKEYMNMMIENEYNKEYRYIPGFLPSLISISIEKIGKMIDLGSQKIDQIDDYSIFNVYYGNIWFNNVVCLGDGEKLSVFAEQIDGIHKIENITVTNCDFDIEIVHRKEIV